MSFLRWRPAGLWRNPDFMKLWTGRTISEVGSRISREGIPLTAVLMLDAQPAQLGILGALASAPVLVLGLLVGVWVDRVRRRPVLIGVDLARAAVLATIPVAAALGLLRVGLLYVVIAVMGALAVVFEVADQSYLPSLVEREHLVEGNGKLGASSSLAEIAGPAVAGGLIQLLTAPIAIAFDAVSFLVSAVSVWLIRKPEPPSSERPSPTPRRVLAEINSGLRLVLHDPRLRALALGTATRAFFGSFFGALYALYAIRMLGITPAVLGILIGLGGVGALPGTLLAGPLARRYGIGATLIGSFLASTLFAFLIPLAPGPGLLAVACLAIAQLFGDSALAVYLVTEVSLRQVITPDHLLGRMNASVGFLVGALVPLGALLGGALGGRLGVRATLLVAALGGLCSVGWLFWSPLRTMQQVPAWQPDKET